jgi:tRNA(adenine34) deaminase
MKEALKEARLAFRKGEVPVGAVVVFENRVIGKGHNQVEMLQDPTAHAEMIAITAAANALENKWLLDATLYVTVEPCSMCAGAIVLARLKKVVYGVQDLKTGAHSSLFNLLHDPRLNHRIEVIPGVLNQDCQDLMMSFFDEVRKRN